MLTSNHFSLQTTKDDFFIPSIITISSYSSRRGPCKWPEVTLTKTHRISPLHRQPLPPPPTANPGGNPTPPPTTIITATTTLPPTPTKNMETQNQTLPQKPPRLRARPIKDTTRLIPPLLTPAQAHSPSLTRRPWAHRLRPPMDSTCWSGEPLFSPMVLYDPTSLSLMITKISIRRHCRCRLGR